jgi:two-component system sensor histidine kinase ChvG
MRTLAPDEANAATAEPGALRAESDMRLGGERTAQISKPAKSKDWAPRIDPRLRAEPSSKDSGAADLEPRSRMHREDAARPERAAATASRPLWKSPLTRRILAVNVVAIAIPVVGLLYLDNYRQSLIYSELELLKTEARLFSGALVSGGVTTVVGGEEQLQPETSRQTLRRLVEVSQTRARLFTPDGFLIADSFLLSGPGGAVVVQPLPPLERNPNPLVRAAEAVYDWIVARWPTGMGDLPPYVENAVQIARDYDEALTALDGDVATAVRDGGQGTLVLSVAVPVQRYRKVLGALLLTKRGDSIEATLRDTRLTVLGVFALALSATVLMSLYLARSIAWPIHRLAEAAHRVRRAKGRQVIIPDFSRRNDEIGELSGALADMTQAVWRRMDAIERFAADVAHEIKNPLTSLGSAVETAARIEDPDQRRKLLAIIEDDVKRLNRLITDISDASRVDAEMSRASAEPVSLRDLLRAIAEVYAVAGPSNGPRIELDIRAEDRLIAMGSEGRLGQVVRNLVANAVSFSPPGGKIALSAWRQDGWIVVSVIDEGPGIPVGKLSAIFERFYSERPKGEKFGLHSGLGLSISRQIVEALGGQLSAENATDANGLVTGARFVLRLPAA